MQRPIQLLRDSKVKQKESRVTCSMEKKSLAKHSMVKKAGDGQGGAGRAATALAARRRCFWSCLKASLKFTENAVILITS